MSHLDGRTFPQRIGLGSVTEIDWNTEEIQTDGGRTKRNQRWANPLRRFEGSVVAMERDDPDYVELVALYADAKGLQHSFDFIDPKDQTDSTIIAMRFITPLRITSLTPDLDLVESFTLEEVRLPDS